MATRYTHAHHVERSDEMVKHSRDDVEDFEDVSGTLCCPPPVLFTAQRVKLQGRREDVFDQGGWPVQCFVRSANVRAKPELARGVGGHAPPENFRKTDALRSILVQSEPICSTLY